MSDCTWWAKPEGGRPLPLKVSAPIGGLSRQGVDLVHPAPSPPHAPEIESAVSIELLDDGRLEYCVRAGGELVTKCELGFQEALFLSQGLGRLVWLAGKHRAEAALAREES